MRPPFGLFVRTCGGSGLAKNALWLGCYFRSPAFSNAEVPYAHEWDYDK